MDYINKITKSFKVKNFLLIQGFLIDNNGYLFMNMFSNCYLICMNFIQKYLFFGIDLPETSDDAFTFQGLTISFLLQPFGVNQPGPYIMYTTVDANGYLKNGSGKTRYA